MISSSAQSNAVGLQFRRRRDPFGVWVCVTDAELHLPQGRIQVTTGSRFAKGTTFMNVDLADMLEEVYWKEHGHPGG